MRTHMPRVGGYIEWNLQSLRQSRRLLRVHGCCTPPPPYPLQSAGTKVYHITWEEIRSHGWALELVAENKRREEHVLIYFVMY